MPFTLHPSGFCVWYSDAVKKNIRPGLPCPFCRRVAGHSNTCELFKEDEKKGTNSRAKLYNAAAVLWARSSTINFFTFTLPSRVNAKTYQVSPTCAETGDIATTAKFSKVLESISVKEKRAGRKFSYVWVSEAQMKRQKKYGGAGDLHFHLVTSAFVDIKWLQNAWNNHVGESKNSVDVQPVPKSIRSVPAYLVKYLGKGSQRYIYSRRFSCTRDLSSFVPVRLTCLPGDVTEISQKIVTHPSGYETCLYYFNTAETLELYGAAMKDEKTFNVRRTDKNFTEEAILNRAHRRTLKRLTTT